MRGWRRGRAPGSLRGRTSRRTLTRAEPGVAIRVERERAGDALARFAQVAPRASEIERKRHLRRAVAHVVHAQHDPAVQRYKPRRAPRRDHLPLGVADLRTLLADADH